MEEIKAPFLNYQKLREISQCFREEHCLKNIVPTPIEEIIESKFGIDIVPIPGLQKVIEAEAFLSSDMTTISIDQFTYENRENRYRFSLAHELAHVILHKEIFKNIDCNDIQEWKKSRKIIPKREHDLMEMQANNLAGLILVPPEPLLLYFQEELKRNIASNYENDVVVYLISEELSQRFLVSREVVKIRIEKDALLK
ncbi:MAG: ImmA/IrrE family metallo-endopeptidase [Candidatus Riflebacteria bacterium]|nr:ImmA/IrrE family metallo-endopeptidase [Candidatus Riflebacteria bacterium]